MKWAYLVRRSTITQIVVFTWDKGKWVTKSMDRSSQTCWGIGRGCRSPNSLCVEYLYCWHVVRVLMNSFTSFSILGHEKTYVRWAKVPLLLEWPHSRVAWNSWINACLKSVSKGMNNRPWQYKSPCWTVNCFLLTLLDTRGVGGIEFLQLCNKEGLANWDGTKQSLGILRQPL